MKNQLEALVRQMHESGILYAEAVREFRKRYIEMVLIQTKGNNVQAARILGLHRNTLDRMTREIGLDRTRKDIRRSRMSDGMRRLLAG